MGRGTLRRHRAALAATLGIMVLLVVPASASALVLSQNGSVNVSATVLPTAPTEAAFIDQPQDNMQLKTTPLVVVGRCGAGLLVRIFNNGVLAGSVTCATDSTFTANINLGYGKNVLSILNYDLFDQPGPASPNITVYVEQPLTPEEVKTINDKIAVAIGSNDTTSPAADAGPVIGPNPAPQRIFEGTILEPAAKLLNLDTTVTATTNSNIAIVTNATFVVLFVVLLALIVL